jgi:pyridoxal phosphate enzyme (YggS family)
MSLAEKISAVKEKIASAAKKSGRSEKDVRLVAVTKNFSSEIIREAHKSGLKIFAENYVQEATEKMADLHNLPLEWHFIGHLQTNKVKATSDKFSLIHSVDRLKLANEISIRSNKNQKVLIEVQLVPENSKSGCPVDELPDLLEGVQSLPNLTLTGLMFMPPLHQTIEEQLRYFSQARKLREKMAEFVSAPHSLIELSMGTSHDFEVAIREGATLVRLGTVLFGERK